MVSRTCLRSGVGNILHVYIYISYIYISLGNTQKLIINRKTSNASSGVEHGWKVVDKLMDSPYVFYQTRPGTLGEDRVVLG